MKKISVIVPVYNVEQYIEKCLISLVNQSIKDIEIIVVNDGSPDNSQKIIDKYVKKYPKIIKSYIKENGGLSDARNYGVNKSSGEYIAFLDSDDWVEIDMYKEMYEKAKTKDFDIVVCDVKYIFDNSVKIVSSNVPNDKFDKKSIKDLMLNIYPTAWNKIYRRDLFSLGVEFKKGVWYEDVEFLYRLLPHINSIGIVKKPFVNYLQRQGAITKTYNRKILDYIDNWNSVIDYHVKNGYYDEYYQELEYSYVRYLFATLIINAAKSKNRELFNEALKNALENVKLRFPNFRKNRYFFQMGLKGLYLKTFNKFVSKIIYLFALIGLI